jgi:Protein of unknown function (DUF2961)
VLGPATHMKRNDAVVHNLRALATSSLAILAFGCTAEAAGDGLPVRPDDAGDLTDAGVSVLSAWTALPVLPRGQYRSFTSHDRDDASSYPLLDEGNKDFNNFSASCGVRLPIALEKTDSASCAPLLLGYLIASDDNGPGVVSRSLFAVGTVDPLSGADVTFDEERVRIYVDDLLAPVYDGKLSDWRNGTAPPFVPPLTTWTSGSLVSYVPIVYQSKLRILLDNLSLTSAYYYRIDLLSGAEPSSVPPRAIAATDVASAWERHRQDARGVEGKKTWIDQTFDVPSGDAVHVLDATGPGTLDLVHLTVDSADPADLRALAISVQWDDRAAPAVDLPLSDLFGAHESLASFDTLPMTVRVDGSQTDLTLSIPMPFASHAVIALANRGPKSLRTRAEIIGTSNVPAGDWGYLHASWREQVDGFAPGGRYVVADLQGRGKYIGTMMFLTGREDPETTTPSPFNFLEGDDRTIVDGVVSKGTGTEETFDGGWYFIDGRYDRPFSALIAKNSDDATAQGAVSMLRWNVLANAMPFQNSFRLDYEYGANRPQTAVSYASVAFYYLR